MKGARKERPYTSAWGRPLWTPGLSRSLAQGDRSFDWGYLKRVQID